VQNINILPNRFGNQANQLCGGTWAVQSEANRVRGPGSTVTAGLAGGACLPAELKVPLLMAQPRHTAPIVMTADTMK
jgi:hypothetical protein